MGWNVAIALVGGVLLLWLALVGVPWWQRPAESTLRDALRLGHITGLPPGTVVPARGPHRHHGDQSRTARRSHKHHSDH